MKPKKATRPSSPPPRVPPWHVRYRIGLSLMNQLPAFMTYKQLAPILGRTPQGAYCECAAVLGKLIYLLRKATEENRLSYNTKKIGAPEMQQQGPTCISQRAHAVLGRSAALDSLTQARPNQAAGPRGGVRCS